MVYIAEFINSWEIPPLRVDANYFFLIEEKIGAVFGVNIVDVMPFQKVFHLRALFFVDTCLGQRHVFGTDKHGYVHHEKCQRTLLKSDGKRRDDDSKGAHQIFFHKSAGTSPKAVVKFPKINILQRFKIPDNDPNIKSIGK
jgi:hypothetical protein